MAPRASDPEDIKPPVRAVTAWQIFTFVAPFVVLGAGQALLLWSDQRTQAVRSEMLLEKINDATSEIRTMRAQLADKGSKDAVQDAQIAALGVRVTAIEVKK